MLWATALAFPLGSLLQPWLLPGRSELPVVPRQLHSPLLLITVPGLRADRIHHLGYGRETTPVLDDLAHHGVSFPESYASSNDSRASAAAIHSALAPERSGILSAEKRLPGRVETLAERLAGAGYHNVALVSDPDLADAGLDQGFARYETLPPGTSSDELVTRAMAAITESPSANWFVWLDLPDLLRPYGGDGVDVNAFDAAVPAGFGAGPDVVERIDAAWQREAGWSQTELDWMSARYDAALLQLDRSIGALLAQLEQSMQLHTMTVCITGTRGERLAERPGVAFTHGVDLYEYSIRVPLLLRLPAQYVRGLELMRMVHSVDVAPTLVKLVLKRGPRAEWTEACGKSLDLDITNQYETNARVFSRGLHSPRGELGSARPASAARAANIKLIAPDDNPERTELYSLTEDPTEQLNRARNAPDVTSAMLRHLDAWRTDCTTH